MRRRLLTFAILAATLAVAGEAYADLTVVVHVAGNTPGVTVVITDRAGATSTCTTDEHGSCEVLGVHPGTVFVEAHAGPSTSAAHVLIPDEEKVSLIVPAPAPPAAPAAPPAAPPTE